MIQLKLASALALTFGLTLASGTLAHAEDSGMNTSSTDSTYSNNQKPGTSGTTTEAREQHTTTHMSEHWKSAKNCTDENGVTYKKGQKGFKTCIEAMRKKEQMGGTTSGQSESGMSMGAGGASGTTSTPSVSGEGSNQ